MQHPPELLQNTMVHHKTVLRLTMVAHIFGILASILILIWLVHYQGGIDYGSHNVHHVFNVHPFLMLCGFIFLAGEGMMAYKTVAQEKKWQKAYHMVLHLAAMCVGLIGICAAFKFHNMVNAAHLRSLHSWAGMATFCLFILQWLFGFIAYLFPKASTINRRRMLPWHISGGRSLLYMAICTALTGLTEKSKVNIHEANLINCIGLSTLLFGMFIDVSIMLGRFV